MAKSISSKILIVDDEYFSQVVSSGMLDRLGYQSDIATSGLHALAMIKEKSYDLILMDCMMPEVDGLETTARIRKYEISHHKEETPIIAITANAIRESREECISVGMNDFIAKPLQLDRLKSVLELFL